MKRNEIGNSTEMEYFFTYNCDLCASVALSPVSEHLKIILFVSDSTHSGQELLWISDGTT